MSAKKKAKPAKKSVKATAKKAVKKPALAPVQKVKPIKGSTAVALDGPLNPEPSAA
jgi:hypothetical protein